MSSAIPRRAARAALVLTVALATAGGVAVAADGGPTTLSVSARVLVAAPQDSPADFPGVGRARAGRPLPAGYVAVARDVRITRVGEAAYAALRMACPRGKTWRSGTATGDIGLTVLDRTVSGKRSVLVMATFDARATALGQTAAGTIHALCR
ncbi:MAG TPA: hypothetical protein VL422_19155 [Miltoncostaea sp.]|nr:hypothetical protein [Miltoncostaea sp.]